MDSITQAVLGAAVGQATLGRQVGKAAPIAGALVATVPDLDVLLYALYDGVEMLRIHRGYSHSLVGCAIGAVLLSMLLKQMRWFRAVSWGGLLLFNALCLVTHILLDYCTAYGTQLLLPFSDARLELSIVNVVDPVYTVPLLLGVLLGWLVAGLRKHRNTINTMGLAVSTGYLVLCFFVKQSVTDTFQQQLARQHATYQQLLTMPVGAAARNWYGVAVSDSVLYISPYRVGVPPTDTVLALPRNQQLLTEYDQDWVQTMQWFSKGFYTVEQQQDTLLFFNLQVDMRGVVQTPLFTAPTQGYFWCAKAADGTYTYGSGTVRPQDS